MVSDSGGVQMPISASCTGQYLKEEAAYQVKKKNFLLGGQLYVLNLISVSVPLPCYRSSSQKIPIIMLKVQVSGYS